LLVAGFLLAMVFWALAEAACTDSIKNSEKISNFKIAARVHIASVWLAFGALTAVFSITFWITICIIIFTTIIALTLYHAIKTKSATDNTVIYKFIRPFVRFALILSLPFVAVIIAVSNFLLRKWGVDIAGLNAGISEDEIRHMVNEGGEKGSIDTAEQEMINNVFAFDDTSAQDICTHRTEIEALDVQSDRDEIIKIIIDSEYSRYPVYEESIDNIIGIIHIKDRLTNVYTQHDLFNNLDLRHNMTEPVFVPVSKKIDDLFAQLNSVKAHMAILVDEYGGCYGLVTIEDMVEEIVGQIYDETDDIEHPPIQETDSGKYIITGAADLSEVAETLNIEIPGTDFETMSGFLVHLLERIPDDGEKPSVSYMGYDFHVREVCERRIYSVLAEKINATNNDNNTNTDKEE